MMKIEELQTIAKENRYGIIDDTEHLIIERDEENIIKISKLRKNLIFPKMDTCFPADLRMLKASLEYASTPIEERLPEKKYYLKHRWMKYAGNKDVEKYYNLHIETNLPYLGSKNQDGENQTQFTQKEIDEIKEKYDTDLKDFEITEVEE